MGDPDATAVADGGADRSFGWYLLVALVTGLLLTRGLTWAGVGAGWSILLVAVALGTGLLVVAVRRADEAAAPAEAPADDADVTEDHSVWNLIPSWQYDGRHVESGGLSRGEQERSLREIQARADEIERLGIDDVDGDDPDSPSN